ncbi:MAG: methyltransferase domain-containing protein [Pseudomonadota bacterium]
MTKAADGGALEAAYQRGLAAEKAGDADKAAEAYREVLRLDPADHGGVSVRLASIDRAPDPERAPEAYVRMLFDQHAAQFDEILVAQLGYRVPEMIADAIRAMDLGSFGRSLDLGCGTGLVAEALSDIAGNLTGVDLSEEMLAEADARGGYEQLFVGDAVQFLAEEDDRFDLIVAADVLPYLGALEEFFAALRSCLSAGTVVAFSTETMSEKDFDQRGWRVGPKARFAHAESYIRARLAENALNVLEMQNITVRHEDGVPVAGHLVIARSAV